MKTEENGTPLGQPWDTTVPPTLGPSRAPGTLKALARNVLKSSVPLSHTLSVGHVGQSIFLPEKSGTSLGQLRNSDLYDSMKRLESAGVCIAVLDTGDMRVIRTEEETLSAIEDGYVIYSPQEMYYYVELEPHERGMLHDFKRRFGGVVEWKEL